jgi:hypothetical protein
MKVIKYVTTLVLAFAFVSTFTQTTQTAYAQQQLEVPQSANASLNWSGYVAGGKQTSGAYTSVTGTWAVPSASSSTAGTADATWVGIGGVASRDLIQAGTQALVGKNGSVTYNAWIETLPSYSQTVPLAVQSGDSVTATINQTSTGQWLITITNNTRGTSYRKTISYNSSLSSAEWVEEMVSQGNGRFIPLDSFGAVNFTNASATVDGTSENISQLGAQPLQMVNSVGQRLAAPSTVNADDASFSVARSAADAASTRMYAQAVRQTHRSRGYTITIVRL